MTASQLARELSDTALAYRVSGDADALRELERLVLAAATHVRTNGAGTVDHIVLSSVLRLIVVDAPSLLAVLERGGWVQLK